MKNALLLGLLVFFSGCDMHFEYYADNWKAADAATDIFHQHWMQGNFSDMYRMSNNALKQHQTEREFIQAVEQTLHVLGPIKVSRQVRAACFPQQVRLVYQTDFANGKAVEKMTWEVHDNRAELASYEIVPGEVDLNSLPDSTCSR